MSLDFPDCVRKRPGMYVGDSGVGGLHQLLWEIVGNSADQFLGGLASQIDVVLHSDGSVEVSDDGSGISLLATDDGRTFLERVLTSLHDTPTADGHAPHVHVGNHGIGMAAVCALCESMRVDVLGEEGRFRQSFARGVATSPLERIGAPSASGTVVRLKPDTKIFTSARWNLARIDRRLRELAALQPGLTTSFQSARHEYGPTDPRALIESEFSVLPEPLLCVGRQDRMTARIALDWSGFDDPEDVPTLLQYSNLERTREGDHIKGLKRGLAYAFAKLGGPHGREWTRPFEILSRGMRAVVSVTLIDPEYGSPTRDQLVHPRVGKLVEKTIVEQLPPLMDHIPEFRDRLLKRLEKEYKNR